MQKEIKFVRLNEKGFIAEAKYIMITKLEGESWYKAALDYCSNNLPHGWRVA